MSLSRIFWKGIESMNDLTTRTTQLPDTLEDLSTFVLVSRAKLQAYMLKLKTVNRLKDAQDIREQTFKEAQEVANALIAAEQRIGEILLAIPKKSANQYGSANSTTVEKAKSEVASEMGYSKDQVSDYQRMAENPDVVRMVLEKAQADGKVVSHAQVMREIKELSASKRALEEQNEMLRKQMLVPEVKVIEKEVPPKDYEMYKTEVKRLEKERKAAVDELLEAKRTIRDLMTPTANDNMIKSAKDSMDYFAIATYSYIKEYGGNVWAFDKWSDVPEQTRKNFVGAIQALSAFAQQMANNLGGMQ